MIWIDVTNAPHILFFKPIIKKLKQEGRKIIITARAHPQAIGMLDLCKMRYTAVGKFAGKSKTKKALSFVSRTLQLAWKFRNKKPDIVISHQSPYAMLAGFLLRIRRRVYIFDNETAALQNLLSIPFATDVICPAAISRKKFFGKTPKKYPGIKEAIYLSDFKPSQRVLKELKLSRKRKIIVIRTEPWEAAYYSENKDVLTPLIREILEKTDWQIVVIPRDENQRKKYRDEFRSGVIVAPKIIDGPSLLHYADLIIGGGGTMNREAAVLGTRALSTYQGKPLSVDMWLIKNGYMHHDVNPSLEKIRKILKNRQKAGLAGAGKPALEMILGAME